MAEKRERSSERNRIKAATARQSAAEGPDADTRVASTRRRSDKAENSIREFTRARARPAAANGAVLAGASAAPAATTETRAPAALAQEGASSAKAVPEHVRQRFVQVGQKYYFPDGARAFTDRGRRLTTPSENTEVIRSLVAIAQARDWQGIAVQGSQRFRKEAWFAARQVGLSVQGYRPSDFEQAHLVRTLAGERRGASPDAPVEEPLRSSRTAASARGRALLGGTLVDHGPAPYHHNPREPMSYFVKLETPTGERVIWGVDLARAFKESLTQPRIGESVGLRAVRRESVTVKAAQRDEQGELTGQEQLQTHRNRWIFEKQEFFTARAAAAQTLRDPSVDPKQAVKVHPELAGTYVQMQAAKLASQRLRDPQDRERFVAQVRSALADSIARGESLPPVRLRERAAARVESRLRSAREAAPARS